MGVDNAGLLVLSCSIPSDKSCRLLVSGWRISHSVAVEIYCVKCQANTSTVSVESVATKNECPAIKVVCAAPSSTASARLQWRRAKADRSGGDKAGPVTGPNILTNTLLKARPVCAWTL